MCSDAHSITLSKTVPRYPGDFVSIQVLKNNNSVMFGMMNNV